MRRWWAALAVALGLLAGLSPAAWGHGLELFGHLAVDERGEVVVRLVDVYGGRVEGQAVELYATPPGGRPTRPAPMTESPPGTYRGRVDVPGAERYELTIDLELGGDLHRITSPVQAGVAQAERVVPMAQIDPAWPWTRVLFVAAAAVLAVGSVFAWRRRPVEPGAQRGEGGVIG